YLDKTMVTTNASGKGTFSVAVSGTPASGDLLTATATDFNGNTSEFALGAPVNGQHLVAVGAGPGGAPMVRVKTDGGASACKFNAYDAAFTGGVQVATGDITGDGYDDIVTAPGAGGGPHVKVFDGKTGALVKQF